MIGVYYIYCIESKQYYIGKSRNIDKRWISHIKLLKRGCHHSIKLQKAFNEYGQCCFQFIVIEECNIDKLEDREQYWIKHYDSFRNGYNGTVGGAGMGKGEDCVNAKFTQQQVNEIRQRILESERYIDIATNHSVTDTTIQDIAKNKTYVDLTWKPVFKARAPLQEEEVKLAKQMLIEGYTNMQIANKLGCAKSVIWDIANKKRFNNIYVKGF